MNHRDNIRLSARVTAELELEFDHDRWVDGQLEGLKGEPVFLTIEPIGDRRSSQSNRYYWGCVLKMISEHTGQDSESLHEYFKAKFLSETFVMTGAGGVVVDEMKITKSTTRLRVMAFSEYIRQIQTWAGEFLHIEFDEAHP